MCCGFVQEQACFHVVNMFACLNRPYQMYGIFIKPHNSFVITRIKETVPAFKGLQITTKCLGSWPM